MRLLLMTATLAALGLAACDDHGGRHEDAGQPLKAVTQLQCPEHQGSLTRVGVAADGNSCDYAGPRGALVTLRLLKAKGDDTADLLTPLEAELGALMPQVAQKVAAGEAKAQAAESGATSSSASDKDRADIDLPGFHVHTHGDRAQVRMPGISVDAQDDDKNHGHGSSHGAAHVKIGGDMVDVRANDDAAIVRIREHGAGVRAAYRLADATPGPDGWRMVGYDARGPVGGPIVVAVIKSKDKNEEHPLFDDAKRLVRANAGG